MVEIKTSCADETVALGQRIGRSLTGGEVIALEGLLGAGKTTFVKGLAAGLGVKDTSEVCSPTFVLLRSYDGMTAKGDAVTLHHMDAYRLGGAAELEDLGGRDLMGNDAVLVVEWAGRVTEGLPDDRVTIRIEHSGEGYRDIFIDGLASSLEGDIE